MAHDRWVDIIILIFQNLPSSLVVRKKEKECILGNDKDFPVAKKKIESDLKELASVCGYKHLPSILDHMHTKGNRSVCFLLWNQLSASPHWFMEALKFCKKICPWFAGNQLRNVEMLRVVKYLQHVILAQHNFNSFLKGQLISSLLLGPLNKEPIMTIYWFI